MSAACSADRRICASHCFDGLPGAASSSASVAKPMIDVVGDAGCELADSLHLLRLAKLGLQASALGDVREQHDEARQAIAIAADGRDAHVIEKRAARAFQRDIEPRLPVLERRQPREHIGQRHACDGRAGTPNL
jgi:hypothetical protein